MLQPDIIHQFTKVRHREFQSLVPFRFAMIGKVYGYNGKFLLQEGLD
jgi:hypothetical protein